ncbi:MAG TPA: hypothetical protein VG737_11165 [Cyclobacteriaceae bacterium]|nr:hypothetical protein [Cyclobacteriaceae bacterium]
MKTQRIKAGILSVLVPGLGQIYKRETSRGAAILAAAIVFANLAIIVLPLISMANQVVPPPASDPRGVWAYWIPRIVHDVAAGWSVVFWCWAVWDAATHCSETSKTV